MSLNRRSFFYVLAVALAVFAASLQSRETIAGDGGRDPRIEGILVSIVARDATIRVKNGSLRTISIPVTAKIERNGFRVPLTAFKVGDRVQARFASNGVTVIKFEGVGP